MTFNFKKLLLTGTALVAISTFGAQAHAADLAVNGAGPFVWSNADDGASVSETDTITVTDADALDAITATVTGKTLTIQGASTGGDDGDDDYAVTIASVSKGSVAALNLIIKGSADADDAITLTTTTGNVDLGTGTLTLFGDVAGNTVTANFTGNLTAAATVLTVDNGTVALKFTGTTAQTVSGTINGDTDAGETITVNNSLASGNAVTFSGAIGGTTAVDSLTVTDGNVAINGAGENKITTLALGASDATVTFGAGVTKLTGAVTTNAGLGALVFNNTGAMEVTGAVGNNALKAITTGTGAIDFDAAVKATTLTTGTGAANFDGAVTATDIIVGAGGATFAGAVGTDTLTSASGIVTIGSSSVLTVADGSDYSAKNTVLTGTDNSKGLVLTAGDFTLASGQTLTVSGVDVHAGDSATVTAAGKAVFASGSAIYVRSSANADDIVAGDTITLTSVGDDADASKALTGVTITSGIAGIKFTATALDANGDLVLTAAETALTQQDTVIDLIANDVSEVGGGTEVADMQARLDAATTLAERNAVVASVSPTVDASVVNASIGGMTQVQGLAETRLASIRSGSPEQGMAAGVSANGSSLWMQGYGQMANQDAKGGVAGYDADTVGGAIGLDFADAVPGAVVGLSFNYGQTRADSDNVNTTRTDVDSYGLNLYGSFGLGKSMFMNGQLGYAYNAFETDRHDVGAPGVTAHGDSNNNQYSAKVTFGSDFAAGGGLTVTPTFTADYALVDSRGYAETGAGGLNLVVADEKFTSVKVGAGVNLGWSFKNTNGDAVKPSLRASYTYDVTGDAVESTASFAGGGGAFTTVGATPDRSSFGAGTTITYASSGNWDMSLAYDYTYRTNYDAHSGVLKATTHF